MTHLSEHQQG